MYSYLLPPFSGAHTPTYLCIHIHITLHIHTHKLPTTHTHLTQMAIYTAAQNFPYFLSGLYFKSMNLFTGYNFFWLSNYRLYWKYTL